MFSAEIVLRDLNHRKSGKAVVLDGGQLGVTGLEFSPDGNYLISAGLDGTALVWDMRAVAARAWRPPLTPPDVEALWAYVMAGEPR